MENRRKFFTPDRKRQLPKYVFIGLCLIGAVIFYVLIGVRFPFWHILATQIIGLVPFLSILITYGWLDRWLPKPVWLSAFAMAWGAFVATAIAATLNTLAGFIAREYFAITENSHKYMLILAGLVAPLVEETIKLLGVLYLCLLGREYIWRPLDVLYLAGLVAGGFALSENVLYLNSTPILASVVFIMRGMLSPFAHCIFTSAGGLALGLALTKYRSLPARIFTAWLGWIGAIILHSLWNGSVVTGAFLAFYPFMWVPLFWLWIVALIMISKQQRQSLRDGYAKLHEQGILYLAEAQLLFNRNRLFAYQELFVSEEKENGEKHHPFWRSFGWWSRKTIPVSTQNSQMLAEFYRLSGYLALITLIKDHRPLRGKERWWERIYLNRLQSLRRRWEENNATSS